MTLTEMHRGGEHAGLHTAGWLVSVLLHGSLLVGAFFFVQRVHLAPQLEPFTWNVAMVSPDTQQAPSAASSSTVPGSLPALAERTPPLTPTRIQPAPPITATPSVSTPSQQADPQPSDPASQTMVLTPPAVAETMDPVPPAPALTPVAPPSPVEAVKPTPTPVESVGPSQPTSYSETSPGASQKESDSSTDIEPSHPEPPTPTSPVATSSEPSLSITPHVTTSPSDTSVPTVPSATQVAALTPPASNRLARMDYGWLSEAILRRVDELKRYPTQARVDRAEGKVVVKAVINEDGSVDDVEIVQSSGYATLDKAAIDLMRRAAPFHLPHPLGKPRVSIKIPMSYRLDR